MPIRLYPAPIRLLQAPTASTKLLPVPPFPGGYYPIFGGGCTSGYHDDDEDNNADHEDDIGILFLNFFSLPRILPRIFNFLFNVPWIF